MKRTFKILIVITFSIICLSSINMTDDTKNHQIDYEKVIEDYLNSKTIEPTIIFNNDGQTKFDLLNHKISWKKLKKGIQITIDEDTIKTNDKVTLNTVWGSKVDSVNFANFLLQIKIYEYDSLVGFVLSNAPCSGLGCGVNYQLIYDLKTKRQSYFGRFRTGFELELYNFNSDNKIDYLSKTFYGRNAQRIDTTEFVMYSQTEKGNFEKFEFEKQKKYWFRHIYSELQLDLNNEAFDEKWIEKINKNSR